MILERYKSAIVRDLRRDLDLKGNRLKQARALTVI